MNKNRELIHIVPSNKWGGVQTYALDICRHYRQEGWHVTVVTQNAVAVDTPFAEADIKLLHAPLSGFTDFSSPLILSDYLKRIPRDRKVTIHVHRYRDAMTAAIARRLSRRHDIRIISTRHAVRRGRNSMLFRKIYSGVDTHLFVSKLARDTFMHSLSPRITGRELIAEQKTAVLRNSLYLPDFTPQPLPASGPLTALYYGPVVDGKGLETLIDAFAMLNGVVKLRLRICGPANPDYADRLRRLAMNRSVMESIDWKIGTSIPPEITHSVHFAVIPSSESEAFGLNSLLMMAAGRGQITTSNGAQVEYLTDGVTALLVPPGDPVRLADAMKRMCQNPELRSRMGEAAITEYLHSHSWTNFISSLDKIYGA